MTENTNFKVLQVKFPAKQARGIEMAARGSNLTTSEFIKRAVGGESREETPNVDLSVVLSRMEQMQGDLEKQIKEISSQNLFLRDKLQGQTKLLAGTFNVLSETLISILATVKNENPDQTRNAMMAIDKITKEGQKYES